MSSLKLKFLWKISLKAGFSLLFGGIFYTVWMAAFLLIERLIKAPAVEAFLWVLAPLLTALGFSAGIILFEHLTRTRRAKFLKIFLWPLAGCAAGAAVVYWFGPMLIVFVMLVAGTASVILRELIIIFKLKNKG